MAVAVVRPRIPGFTRGHGRLKQLVRNRSAAGAGRNLVRGLIKITANLKIKLDPSLFNTKGTFTLLEGTFWAGHQHLQYLADIGQSPANTGQWILDTYVTIDGSLLLDVTVQNPHGTAVLNPDGSYKVTVTLV